MQSGFDNRPIFTLVFTILDKSNIIYPASLNVGDKDGNDRKERELEFKHSMVLPAFKGVDAVMDIEGLTNPRGFILIDDHQRNPKYQNIFAVGVFASRSPLSMQRRSRRVHQRPVT